MRKILFQRESSTLGRFMTASIITLHMMLVVQLWIYPPLTLMIYSTRIKEPAIPLICSQLKYLLPLKILLVLLPPLLIIHYSVSYLLIILTLPMQWRKMILTVVGWKEVTAVGNMMQKYATKRRCYISPRALINTRTLLLSWVFQD